MLLYLELVVVEWSDHNTIFHHDDWDGMVNGLRVVPVRIPSWWSLDVVHSGLWWWWWWWYNPIERSDDIVPHTRLPKRCIPTYFQSNLLHIHLERGRVRDGRPSDPPDPSHYYHYDTKSNAFDLYHRPEGQVLYVEYVVVYYCGGGCRCCCGPVSTVEDR